MKDLRDIILERRGLPSREEQAVLDEKKRLDDDKKKKIDDLVLWFEAYDRQVAECLRCKRLGLICEHNIIELDIEAESKRAMLKQLRINL